MAAQLADPKSARFQAVRSRAGHVCGEVNARDAAGAWQGYRRFLYDTGSGSAALDPRHAPAAGPAEAANPACAKPLSYRTVEERFACDTAPASGRAKAEQSAFDERWRRICEP